MSTLQEASDLENNVTDAFVLVLKVSFFCFFRFLDYQKLLTLKLI